MSFIQASFWGKKIKADSFDELRVHINEYKPDKINISIKPHAWKKNDRNNIGFDLRGSFQDIDKELRVLQKKFSRF